MKNDYTMRTTYGETKKMKFRVQTYRKRLFNDILLHVRQKNNWNFQPASSWPYSFRRFALRTIKSVVTMLFCVRKMHYKRKQSCFSFIQAAMTFFVLGKFIKKSLESILSIDIKRETLKKIHSISKASNKSIRRMGIYIFIKNWIDNHAASLALDIFPAPIFAQKN